MPFMYPEELAKLRADHPGLQYDGHGRVIGATPPDSVQMAADAIYQLPGMQPNAWDFGSTRNDFQNSKDFVGPLQQQWWDPNGELMQQGQNWLGSFMAGRDLGMRRPSRPRNPYVQSRPSVSAAPDVSNAQNARLPGLRADAAGILADAGENTWGINPIGYRPSYDYRYAGYGLQYPYDDHDDGSGEFTPGV